MDARWEVTKDGRKRYANLQLDTVLEVDDVDEPEYHQPAFEEDGDALDMKAERFFALMRRIRDVKKSWGQASIKRKCNAPVTDALASSSQKDAPAPAPLWTPGFRWEDFAPNRPAAGMAGTQLVAAAAATKRGQEEIDTLVENIARPRTHGEGVTAGDGDGQGRKMTNIQVVVDNGTNFLGTSTSADSQDFDRGVVDRGASVSSPSGGRVGNGNHGTASAASVELKLYFW